MNLLYLAKGVQATTAIEGNTLRDSDALTLAKGDEVRLPPSQEYLGTEVHDIVDACNRVKDELLSGASATSPVGGIKRFNSEVLRDLEVEDHVRPGELHIRSVVVRRTLSGSAC